MTIGFINQWTQLFFDYNWYTLNLFQIELDYDKHTNDITFTLIIMGLGFYINKYMG